MNTPLDDLEQRWGALRDMTQTLDDDMRLATRDMQRLRKSIDDARQRMSKQVPLTWPARIAIRALGRSLSMGTVWRGEASALRQRYLRATQSEVERLVQPLYTRITQLRDRDQRRFDSQIDVVKRALAKTDQAMQRIEQQLREALDLVGQARKQAGWLLALPLPLLQQPSGWLRRSIAPLRRSSGFAFATMRQVRAASRLYDQAWRWLQQHAQLLPDAVLAQIGVERLKLRCFLVLLPRRRQALQQIAAEVSAAVDHTADLPLLVRLDAAQMLHYAALYCGDRRAGIAAATLFGEALPLISNDVLRIRIQAQLREVAVHE